MLLPWVSSGDVPAREPSTQALAGWPRVSGALRVIVPEPFGAGGLTAAIVRTSGLPAPRPLAGASTVTGSPAAKFVTVSTVIVRSSAEAAAISVALLSR